MKLVSKELKDEVIRLRVEKRASLTEIIKETRCKKTTVYYLLKDYPLTKEEYSTRKSVAAKKQSIAVKKQNSERGKKPNPARIGKSNLEKLTEYIKLNLLTHADKGRIAEFAILYRVAIEKLTVMAPLLSNAKEDFVLGKQNGKRLCRIQVKWTFLGKQGLPSVSLRCSNGSRKHRRYTQDEFDFIIGFDPTTDAVYIYSNEELAFNKNVKVITACGYERWDKIHDFIGTKEELNLGEL